MGGECSIRTFFLIFLFFKMGFMQFLGQVKQGKGMAALSREADRLGVKKVENMARIGVTIGKALGIRRSDSRVLTEFAQKQSVGRPARQSKI